MVTEPSGMAKYWMALSSVRNIGAKTVHMLVERFGSPENVLSAEAHEIARLTRLNLELAHKIVRVRKDLAKFEKLISAMSKRGIDTLCPNDCEYPHLLKLIDCHPPILYRKGVALSKEEPTVAIVGTRFPTTGGIESAEKIASILAGRGFVVVSGLAKGIDTMAHRGALKAGGRTLAILGSGLNMIYPRENRRLADSIYSSGAVFSECHPNELVSKRRLIQRNRIISGVSLGVILIEPEKGALNTAFWASKQRRRIFIYDPKGIIPYFKIPMASNASGEPLIEEVIPPLMRERDCYPLLRGIREADNGLSPGGVFRIRDISELDVVTDILHSAETF